MKYLILTAGEYPDYELLDSGEGRKLERYGEILLSRPDPGALWRKHLSESAWQKAPAEYIRKGEKGNWVFKGKLPDSWPIDFGGSRFLIKPSSFKHTGLFPEQEPNWRWMQDLIAKRSDLESSKGPVSEIKVLNLFAYTGGASLACARAGAEVLHLDASKKALDWTKENIKLSGLEDRTIRLIPDDAIAFLKREIKRGNRYEAIIMDPPAFGHGPKDELWKIEEDFLPLFDMCLKVLSDRPLFFLINGYASGYSPIAFENNLKTLTDKYGGRIEAGELAIKESASGRLLPAGIFARWQA